MPDAEHDRRALAPVARLTRLRRRDPHGRERLKGARSPIRAEAFGARLEDPERPETGARDQFQRYEVVFAAGDLAGVPGKERAALWHERAIHDLGARFGSLVGG